MTDIKKNQTTDEDGCHKAQKVASKAGLSLQCPDDEKQEEHQEKNIDPNCENAQRVAAKKGYAITCPDDEAGTAIGEGEEKKDTNSQAISWLTEVEFNAIVYKAKNSCLVMFTKENCPICKEIFKALTALLPKYKDIFGFYAVDVKAERELYSKFKLKGVPQILFFKKGDYYEKIPGQLEDGNTQGSVESLIEEIIAD